MEEKRERELLDLHANALIETLPACKTRTVDNQHTFFLKEEAERRQNKDVLVPDDDEKPARRTTRCLTMRKMIFFEHTIRIFDVILRRNHTCRSDVVVKQLH